MKVNCKPLALCAFALLGFAFTRSYADTSVPLKEWTDKQQRLSERTRLLRLSTGLEEFSDQKQVPVSNLLKSAVLPGWGQRSARHASEGNLFLLGTIAGLGTGAVLFELSNQEYEAYKTAVNIDDIEKHYGNSISLLNKSQVALGVTAGVWAFGAIDAIFTTQAYNRKLFDHFYDGSLGEPVFVPTFGLRGRGAGVEVLCRLSIGE